MTIDGIIISILLILIVIFYILDGLWDRFLDYSDGFLLGYKITLTNEYINSFKSKYKDEFLKQIKKIKREDLLEFAIKNNIYMSKIVDLEYFEMLEDVFDVSNQIMWEEYRKNGHICKNDEADFGYEAGIKVANVILGNDSFEDDVELKGVRKLYRSCIYMLKDSKIKAEAQAKLDVEDLVKVHAQELLSEF